MVPSRRPKPMTGIEGKAAGLIHDRRLCCVRPFQQVSLNRKAPQARDELRAKLPELLREYLASTRGKLIKK